MELTCRSCGKHFQNTGNKKWAKYCPACQKQADQLRRQKRINAQRAVRRRRAALDARPAHRLDLDTILRELDRFNAQRRAEGRSSISYGRYVAMRDGYIQLVDPGPAVRQPPDNTPESTDQNLTAFRQQTRRKCDGKENAA